MIIDQYLRLVKYPIWYLGLLYWALPHRISPEKKCVAVFRLDAIGDYILFAPALKYLREQYSDYHITLILRNEVAPLAAACPYVDEVMGFNARKYERHLGYRLSFLRRLAKAGFSVALYPVYSRNTHGDEMVLFTGAARKFAWDYQEGKVSSLTRRRCNPIYTRVFRSNPRPAHELQRNREFLHHLGILAEHFKPELWLTADDRSRAEKILPPDIATKHLVAILPGSLQPFKKWGAVKFNLLMERLAAIDRKAFFISVGGPGEGAGLGLENRNGESPYLDLCGRTNLRELAFLFAQCRAVVGNDTGPLHLAMAAGVPTVCILGGGHFGRFMPYGDSQRNRFVYHEMDCFNCNWRCRYDSYECITRIGVDEVFKELATFVKS